MSVEGGEGAAQKRPYSSGPEGSMSIQLPAQNKRVRTETARPGFVNSESMQISSSSPQSASAQASQGSSASYISQVQGSPGIPEQATVQIASAFLRHVLWACPPQDDTRHHKPAYLVEFSAVLRKLAGGTAIEARIRATADGQLLLYTLDDGRYRLTRHCPALLEAKKRFAVIEDGEPVLTDRVLGQMTCEALALRLQQTGRVGPADENVFVIAAVRRYMRFLQFEISESYIVALTKQNQDLTDFVELWATPWFDLKSPAGRCNAVDNIVALVRR